MASRVRSMPRSLTEEVPKWDDFGEYYSSCGIISEQLYNEFTARVMGDSTMESANRLAADELGCGDWRRSNTAAFVIREKAKSHTRIALWITNNNSSAMEVVLGELYLEAVTDQERDVLRETFRLMDNRVSHDRAHMHQAKRFIGEAEPDLSRDHFLRGHKDSEIERRAMEADHTRKDEEELEKLQIRRRVREEFESLDPAQRHDHALNRFHETTGYEKLAWRNLINEATSSDRLCNPIDPRVMPKQVVKAKEYLNSLVTGERVDRDYHNKMIPTLTNEGIIESTIMTEDGRTSARIRRKMRGPPALIYYMSRKRRRA